MWAATYLYPLPSVPELSPSFPTGDKGGDEVKQHLGSPSVYTESVSMASGVIPTVEPWAFIKYNNLSSTGSL